VESRHFVDRPGYWVYDPKTRTITHHQSYPVTNIDHWIYCGSQGHVLVKNDKIIDFYPAEKETTDQNKNYCLHSSKEYIGFTDRFMYCSKCGIKL